jgi:hypothetical protein
MGFFDRITKLLTLIAEVQILLFINQCGENGNLLAYRENIIELRERLKQHGNA